MLIKSMTQVVLTIMLSFGVMAAGVNPGLRAEIQAAGTNTAAVTASILNSASISLSNTFSGNAATQASLTGPADVSAHTDLDLNGSISLKTKKLTSTIQSGTGVAASNNHADVSTLTNGSATVGTGSTNVGANTNLGLNGSVTDDSLSASGNAQTGASATLGDHLFLDAHDQLDFGLSVTK